MITGKKIINDLYILFNLSERFKMKKNILTFVFVMLVCLLSLGMATQDVQADTTVKNVSNSIPGKQTLKSIEAAIIKASTERGWIPEKQPNTNIIECTLLVRKHSLVIDIAYSLNGYTMTYKSSSNLNYDPAKNTIHSKYDNWTNNLNIDIQKALAENQIP